MSRKFSIRVSAFVCFLFCFSVLNWVYGYVIVFQGWSSCFKSVFVAGLAFLAFILSQTPFPLAFEPAMVNKITLI